MPIPLAACPRQILGLLAVVGLAACTESISSPVEPLPEVDGLAAQADLNGPQAQTLRYIVRLSGAPATSVSRAADFAASLGFDTDYVYSRVLTGFAARLSDRQLEALRAHPLVQAIDADGIVTATEIQSPVPSWGLDRGDQRVLPLDNSYEYGLTGAGVTFYGLDTGIRSTHQDFLGRMQTGADFINDGNGTEDCNGHGTHTASTAAGTTYGVAKAMDVVPVRVLNCSGSGTFAQVIAGVDWVVFNASGPAVANMSLTGGGSAPLDAAVASAISQGVTFVVSAGNDNADACGYSPARTVSALTVGSTTITDARSSSSNFGTCLDIFAPGSDITAAWANSDSGINTISGTSMAAPHVAGVAGLFLESDPSSSPAEVSAAITSNATAGAVGNPGPGSPNLMLYMGFLTVGPPNQAPTASWVWSATTNRLTLDGTGSSDPDGTIDLYEWLHDTFGLLGTDPILTLDFPPGTVATEDLTLRVTDNDEATDELTQTVEIGEG